MHSLLAAGEEDLQLHLSTVGKSDRNRIFFGRESTE